MDSSNKGFSSKLIHAGGVKDEMGTFGGSYTVEPLEALTLDWQQRRLEEMLNTINELSPEELKVLEYLRITSKTERVTDISRALYHSTGSNYRKTISIKALAPMKEKFLVDETSNGYKHTIPEFIRHYIGETEDYEVFEQHIIDALRKRRNGSENK